MYTNNVITKSTITSLLNKTAEKENISNPKYNVTYTTKKGDGFMSVIYYAKVNDNEKEVLSVVTKIAPENKIFREQSSIRMLFETEVLFYNEIYPAFQKFQIEKGIPFKFAPKCYASSLEEEKEGLVLEDLRAKGYKVWNRTVPMDEDHIELTVRTIAKYHALCFAFKDEHKEMFDEFASKTPDIYEHYASHSMHKEVYDKLMESAVGFLDPVEDKKYMDTFADYINSLDSQRDLFYRRNMDEYSVIVHGDCWCNNIMYKYDDPTNPTKPTGIFLLDFQLIRYSTPVADFTYYFYTSSPKKVLDNIEYYLNLYYDTLASFVRQLGSDPDKVYPRKVFEAHWKKYCVGGINMAMFMMKFVTSDSNEVPVFSEVVANESITSTIGYEPKDTGYRKRIKDVILHFCEKGFI